MASLCSRCALRLQRAAATETRATSKRAFSYTPSKRRGLPTFTETSQPELDDVLLTLRKKHWLPAALSNRERNLIFKPKHKKLIEDNPTVVTIGDEDFKLEWTDRINDIPSRHHLLPEAIRLMAKGEGRDWNNLPALLTGLRGAKMMPAHTAMAKIIYEATSSGRFGIILQCLHQAHNTGMTMKKDQVLNAVMWSLHHIAQNDEWSEAATAKAIKDANEVASQLEDEEHGTGKYVQANDPRMRPYVLGTFLELASVNAYKFQDRKDLDGKVRAYSERLLSNMEGHEKISVEPKKLPASMMQGIPIWQGLRLARKILDSEMPQPEYAKTIVHNYGKDLQRFARKKGRKKSATQQGSFYHQALTMWKMRVSGNPWLDAREGEGMADIVANVASPRSEAV